MGRHDSSFQNSEARTRSRPGVFAHFRPDLREQVNAAQLQKEVASVAIRCFQPTLSQDGNELRHRVQIDSAIQARMVRTAVAILHAHTQLNSVLQWEQVMWQHASVRSVGTAHPGHLLCSASTSASSILLRASHHTDPDLFSGFRGAQQRLGPRTLHNSQI